MKSKMRAPLICHLIRKEKTEANTNISSIHTRRDILLQAWSYQTDMCFCIRGRKKGEKGPSTMSRQCREKRNPGERRRLVANGFAQSGENSAAAPVQKKHSLKEPTILEQMRSANRQIGVWKWQAFIAKTEVRIGIACRDEGDADQRSTPHYYCKEENSCCNLL